MEKKGQNDLFFVKKARLKWSALTPKMASGIITSR